MLFLLRRRSEAVWCSPSKIGGEAAIMGNEEMSGNEARAYNDAATAQLGERVTNLGRRQSDLESEMRSGFKNVETTMSAIANEMRSSISTLSASIAERSRTQWPVIWTAAGVSFTILAALSAFVYGTLSKDQTRLDAAIMKNAEIIQASVTKLAETTQQNLISMSERMVTRQEMEYRQQRGAEDRVRMEANIKDVRDAQVPRPEMELQWNNINHRLDRLEGR
jgi:hypothetical protein